MTVISPSKPIDVSDAPFAVPPVIVFDLPVPPSVNRTRKVDWRAGKKFKGWTKRADLMVLGSRCRSHAPQPRMISGAYELLIVLSEKHTRIDLDNGIKWLVDYLRRIEAVTDDSQKYFHKLTVEWGDAPEGCRVHIRGLA